MIAEPNWEDKYQTRSKNYYLHAFIVLNNTIYLKAEGVEYNYKNDILDITVVVQLGVNIHQYRLMRYNRKPYTSIPFEVYYKDYIKPKRLVKFIDKVVNDAISKKISLPSRETQILINTKIQELIYQIYNSQERN